MPFYEYECKNCGKRFEKMQSITAEPLTECLNCGGGPIHRVLQPVGVIFKGSGWYVTDSKKPAASNSDTRSKSAKDESAPAAESKGSDSKSADGGSSETKSSETKSSDSSAGSKSSAKPASSD
jgi:putative FmdB family regulatory protein